MSDLLKLGIWTVGIGVAFLFAWKRGWLLKLGGFVAETREELRKCTWPNFEELKGHTVVVLISIAILGVFTVVADLVLSWLLPMLTTSG